MKNLGCTTGKAAEIAKVSIWEMQEILAQRKFPLNYYTEDLEADIKTLKHFTIPIDEKQYIG